MATFAFGPVPEEATLLGKRRNVSSSSPSTTPKPAASKARNQRCGTVSEDRCTPAGYVVFEEIDATLLTVLSSGVNSGEQPAAGVGRSHLADAGLQRVGRSVMVVEAREHVHCVCEPAMRSRRPAPRS